MSTIESEVEFHSSQSAPSASRLSSPAIDAVIIGETFTVLPSGRTVICELTLRNGFTVRGSASVVSKENFDQTKGEELSREDARRKVWELEAYLVREREYIGQMLEECRGPDGGLMECTAGKEGA